MNYDIKIEGGKHRYGYIKGRIDHFSWYALVHKEQIEFGINPKNLQAGEGRISRLCVYKEFTEQGGNPFLPTSSVKRYIFANYKREWDVLNTNYEDMVRQLVNYLERRYSLRLIKNVHGFEENNSHIH